ncbi:MAG: helix-turn-helix domain-containing protein [Streptosporangiaceae bacterium]|nr:helix-turn-helix domain-containing protein [Streptosporangiaceae bacterium]
MPATPSPTARARRLRHELRRLREEAGLNHSEVAHQLEWSPSKLSRIENGQSRVNAGDVIDLLGAYGITDQTTREALIQLAREARRRGWWTRYTDVLGSGTYIGLEAEASTIHTYESQFVPGLLQTEDYARAVISGGQVRPDPEAVERRVAARMARQELFTRPEPPEIWAVLDESVILRPVGGPAVMRDQLRHLIEVTTRPSAVVTLQVLPLSAGAHPGMSGPFVILGFQNPKDPPMIHLETATDGHYLEEPPDIERYTLRFNHLVARALGPNESRAMITALAEQMA